MRKFQLFIKRAFDLVASISLLILLIIFPVFIIVPILIKIDSKGPAIFTQERTGKDGKVFKIYKFRTMRIPEDSLDENGNMLEPKKRITKLGAILRKTSIDELAQVFNIINGTMSFVGPRPTLPYQSERYNERQKKRHDMRPGITGWAQVNGRNELTWSEKLEYDVEYIENFSLWFDIKILFKTVAVVFKQEGIAFNKNDAINAKTPAETAKTEGDSASTTSAAAKDNSNE